MRVSRFVQCALVVSTGYVTACTDLVDDSQDLEPTLHAAGDADLVETSVGNPPASATNGSTFLITDTVQNVGMLAAPASQTRVYLSLDGVNVFGSALLGNRAVAALAPGATDTGMTTATIPDATAQGTYFILACADRTNLVQEVNDNNNCRASTGQIVVTAPDLTEGNVSVSPTPVNATGTVNITETVSNGTMAAAGISTTRFYFSTDNVKSADDGFVRNCVNGGATPGRNVPALAGAASSTGTTAVPLCVRDNAGLHQVAVGTYFVIACADELHEVSETIENNNCAVSTSTFQVTLCGNGTIETGETCDDSNTTAGDGCSATCTIELAADLVETSITAPPASASVGTAFTVTDTVQNTGVVTAAASTTRYFLSTDKFKSVDDTALTGSRAVGSLVGAATSTGTVTVTVPNLPAGSYFMLACADADSTVAEGNEMNNCISSVTTLTLSGPDLVETAVSNPPANAAVGGSFTISDTVQNIGASGAIATTTKYYLSLNGVQVFGSTFLGSRAVNALASGATDAGIGTVTIPAGTSQGTYFVLACADRGPGVGPLSQVVETNENNNCRSSAGTVSVTAPDLTQNTVVLTPTSVTAGTSIMVTETVTNATATPAGASFTRFYLSSDAVKSSNDGLMWGCVGSAPIPQRSVPALAAGASSTGTTTLRLCVVDGAGLHPIAPGSYFMIACADQTGAVLEVNENNNCTASAMTFTVTP